MGFYQYQPVVQIVPDLDLAEVKFCFSFAANDNYLSSLKNPGSGWEHHFKPSSAAGMGAKPSPIANASGGQVNPWKTGNLTQQMILLEQDPQLAAVLKQEAQK